MEWYIYLAVVGAGFLAGFINTIAFSGSLITLPLLIFLGLPANIANGTNRIAILLQGIVATRTFKKSNQIDITRGLILAIPAVLGSIVGAQIAVAVDEDILRKAIGVLMVVMLIVIFVRPKRWLEGKTELTNSKLTIIQFITFFGVGLYGGFIQAGVGIFLLAGLVLSAGFDLVKANALKNFIVLIFTIFALVVFILNGQVEWGIGLILGIGNMLGARVAAKMAIKNGAPFVRWVLIAILILSAIILLGIGNQIKELF
ncbi:MAG: sulfite exporter TauE/SafE family protein [Candidatus Zixiibacteriota bacterium]